MPELLIGTVSHYYGKIEVAAIRLETPLHAGDLVRIAGHTTDLEQTIESMEVDHRDVDAAEVGEEVAIKVVGKVRAGDKVYRQPQGASPEQQG